MRERTVPADMAIAPALGPIRTGRAIAKHSALLVNPFYAKDPRASRHRWITHVVSHCCIATVFR